MAQINLGRIGIVPKGEWNNIFTYNRLDLVAYAGGGYVSLVDDNNNKLPTDTAYWLQISEKGETGNIDNLEDWHISDALGYTPANKAVVDAHMADNAAHNGFVGNLANFQVSATSVEDLPIGCYSHEYATPRVYEPIQSAGTRKIRVAVKKWAGRTHCTWCYVAGTFAGQVFEWDYDTSTWKKVITQNDVRQGAGSPEGVITARVGTIYQRTDVGELYVKKTGTGNTGWKAVQTT